MSGGVSRGRQPPRSVREAPGHAVTGELQELHQDHEHADNAFFEWVKDRSHLFRGVTFGTMLRDEGYAFSRVGTFVERADNTARILDVKYHILLPSVDDVGGAVDPSRASSTARSPAAATGSAAPALAPVGAGR